MNITGKNAIVTGATHGIGLAVCRQLLQSGVSNIGLLDIVDDNVSNSLKQEFPCQSVVFYKTDVSNKQDVFSAFSQFINDFESIHIVIGNAGIVNEFKPNECVQINLMGIIHTTYEAINWMSTSKKGSGGIVANISSVSALNTFVPWGPVYTATKHAVLGFTKSMANETNSKLHGINFITICPGGTTTTIVDNPKTRVKEELLDSLLATLTGDLIQTPAEFAKHLVEVIEENKNGSIFVVENNKRAEFHPVGYTI